MKSINKELWGQFNDLRANSNLKIDECCIPVLGIVFLKHMYLRFKDAEMKISRNKPIRGGLFYPIDEHDFARMGVIRLPEQAQFKWILESSNISRDRYYWNTNSLGNVLNNAMLLIEEKSQQLADVLFKEYNKLPDSFLRGLLEIFSREDIDYSEVYEYFLENFAFESKNIFVSRSLAKMIVNVLEPERGTVLDPACGSGNLFVQIKKYMDQHNHDCGKLINFHGHEKSTHNAKLCLMNVIANGLDVKVTYDKKENVYHHHQQLDGRCNYVMSVLPSDFNSVGAEQTFVTGNFNSVYQTKSASNVDLFDLYSYLNENGKAGFAIPSTALDDNQSRRKIVETKHVDLLISVAPKFKGNFREGDTLCFLNKQKTSEYENKILFINASEIGDIQNDWQIKNLNAVVWLYRGQNERYSDLLKEYRDTLKRLATQLKIDIQYDDYLKAFEEFKEKLIEKTHFDIAVLKEQVEKLCDTADEGILIAREYNRIHSKFGEGGYKNILGFCKVVDLEEVSEKNYSLMPSSYVDVAKKSAQEANEVLSKLESMHRELAELNKESNELMAKIQNNMLLWKK